MDANEFLTRMGWPDDRMGEAGQARWSGAGADGISQVVATLSRTPDGIEARVDAIDLDSAQNLLTIEAQVDGALAKVSSSRAGEPPEAIPAEDALDLFAFMRQGLPTMKFESTGPIQLPARAARPAA